MFAIRLLAETTAAGTIVLPVEPDPGSAGARLGPVPDQLALDGDRAKLVESAAALLTRTGHDGSAGETQVLHRPRSSPYQVILVGIGAADEAGWRTAGAAVGGLLRRAAQPAAGPAAAQPVVEPCLVAVPPSAGPAAIRGFAEGCWLAGYRFTAPGESRPAADTDEAHDRLPVVLLAHPPTEAAEQALRYARVTAAATCLARDLTNMPSSVKNPAWFADQVAAAAADRPGLTVSVRGPAELTAEGFGALLAVGGGSAAGSRLVEIDWSPPRAGRHVVLAGKGITFDTGGISIKPVDGMKLMRKDMGGAAAVVATAVAAADLELPVRLTVLVPLAENMVSGAAFRPGDVVRHYGGRTSETTNSDAEGRLVLADAISYAVSRFTPDYLVDLATLTGANAIALGRRTAALYSEDDDLAAALLDASAAAGEGAWRMPLHADYVEYLGSEIADLFSAPDRGAGSVVAALYLREFTGPLRDRWAHYDMSAPAWSDDEHAELTRGATGWGVRTLVRWLTALDPAA
ncbi:leucyl aminopeptidase family protein [Solwaraspora sp. WMMD937]|uniref:leucyl aminopeptidase family protein n=1 Tax=Solwaraspora sp. WMMD937 TaxID=3016090 RepID=UPI00249BFEC2|nr:leucyl aminopeptidase family protein [Solwaraspora sp. WMMD937]WFE22025.1 leucyl aminopeptidase family protein [Solwaraspora sp. WMMD937]